MEATSSDSERRRTLVVSGLDEGGIAGKTMHQTGVEAFVATGKAFALTQNLLMGFGIIESENTVLWLAHPRHFGGVDSPVFSIVIDSCV